MPRELRACSVDTTAAVRERANRNCTCVYARCPTVLINVLKTSYKPCLLIIDTETDNTWCQKSARVINGGFYRETEPRKYIYFLFCKKKKKKKKKKLPVWT